jgi:class 3 adenylate cyclase/tetratricopeptide (TPR) repeat protein
MTAEIAPFVPKEPRANAGRRVAAIMYADAARFSQLMGSEETWTLTALSAARRQFGSAIGSHGGRVVSMPGDAVLAEFGSVEAAVRSAVAAQRAFLGGPAVSPNHQSMQFRIGLHLADVVADGDDILGDGVNTAARIAELAEPGGICISAGVYEGIHNKLDLLLSDLGDVPLRGLDRQARLYRIDVVAEESVREGDEIRQGTVQLIAHRPSVAVLPFSNLSATGDDDHIADGLTDTLINALSCSRLFHVIGRSSSFRYRNTGLNVREVGRGLGARFLVQGSVQRLGANFRVMTHLINSATGALMHSHKFEGNFVDAFSMQDTLALQIAATIEPGIILARRSEQARSATPNVTALDHALRAYSKLWEMTPSGVEIAKWHLNEAIAAEPSLSQAHTGIALAAILEVYMGWTQDPESRLKTAGEAAILAIRLDGADAWAYMALGNVYLQSHDVDQAIAMFKSAIRLNPSLALAYGFMAHAMIFTDKISEAQSLLRLAMRLSPRDLLLAYWLDGMAMAHLLSGRLDDALYWAQRTTQENAQWPGGFRVLAIVQARLNHLTAAREALERMLQLQPNFSLAYMRRIWPFRNAAHFESSIAGLRAAGWTEASP